ncbi:BAF1 ABF1 chromatin reorganising factor [Fusarium albosuccineum]|uniref:BAF1 ABF1 chromatin reorganising factor n=1 Tax=Fusarium albosuccineum TaxID=1237068 RepID=A0A8H4LH09_9HYPO|nr:BAF1 ABF1 chromatin reorganising factor [Fusarium albosuccineum]
MDPYFAIQNMRSVTGVTEGLEEDDSRLKIGNFNPESGSTGDKWGVGDKSDGQRTSPLSRHFNVTNDGMVKISSLKRKCAAAGDRTEDDGTSPPRTKPFKPLCNYPWGTQRALIGCWKGSTAPVPHAVTGFIDGTERLRFRIENSTASGVKIPCEWPLPPGPTGQRAEPGLLHEEELGSLESCNNEMDLAAREAAVPTARREENEDATI